MKTLPTESELHNGFNDFSKFTFELFEKVTPSSKYLKFAAVNSQVALELFLKYYFVKLGKTKDIQKTKNGKLINDFKDFSQILSHFYSTRRWSYGKKKELAKLLDSRNSIVHRGQSSTWDAELAESVVRTLFFIHATAWSEFKKTVLFNNNLPHKISENSIWRKAAEDFASDVDDEVYCCLGCGAYAVIYSELMVLDDSNSEDDLICLCCLSSLDTRNQAKLLECYKCFEKSYYIDSLNEQEDQLYVGKCVECETSTWVRKCKECEKYYHPSESKEVHMAGKYFCSKDCWEIYREGVGAGRT